MSEQRSSNIISPNIYQPAEKSDLLEKLNPSEIVEIIRNKLMGKELNQKTGLWIFVPALQKRALTELGAWDLANLMLPASSRNVSVSKLKDEEIRKRVLNLCRQAQVMCLRNWKEYGIKGTDQLNFVHQIIITNSLVSLKQPQDEGIRKLLMGTMSEQRQVSEMGETPQKRGLSGLFRR